MNSLATVSGQDIFVLPEARVLAMLEQCAEKIAEAASVVDAAQAATMADAIATMTRKMNLAKEIKVQAMRIALDAEIKLGEMSKRIPKVRGRYAVKTPLGAVRPVSKERTLRDLGLDRVRCTEAEKIAERPKAEIDAAFARSKTKSMNSLKVELGIRPANSETRIRAAKFEEDVDFLAGEAVALLQRAVREDRAPHTGTVDELARRLAHLRMNRQRWRTE